MNGGMERNAVNVMTKDLVKKNIIFKYMELEINISKFKKEFKPIGRIKGKPLYFQYQIEQLNLADIATLTRREKTNKAFLPKFKGEFYIKLKKEKKILLGERSFYGGINSRILYFAMIDKKNTLIKKYDEIVKEKGLEKQSAKNDKQSKSNLNKSIETTTSSKQREVSEKKLTDIQTRLKYRRYYF